MDYQLDLLSEGEGVLRRLVLECRDDGHAITIVAETIFHQAMELWQDGRLVKRFEAER